MHIMFFSDPLFKSATMKVRSTLKSFRIEKINNVHFWTTSTKTLATKNERRNRTSHKMGFRFIEGFSKTIIVKCFVDAADENILSATFKSVEADIGKAKRELLFHKFLYTIVCILERYKLTGDYYWNFLLEPKQRLKRGNKKIPMRYFLQGYFNLYRAFWFAEIDTLFDR